MIEGVIFDMDGLMIDTEYLTYKFFRRHAAEMGYDLTLDIFKPSVGRRTPDSKIYYKSVFGQDFDFDLLRQKNLDDLHKYMKENGVPKKRGIVELLEFLKKSKIKCAVASSTSKPVAEKCLENAGLLDYFEAGIYGNMVENGKPAPDIFIAAAAALGIPCERCLCLEDSYNGIRAGHSAKMVTIMVPDMLPPTKEMQEKCYAIVPDLLKVIDIIRELNA